MNIWKFPLEVQGEQVVSMPRGAKILTVQVQGTEVCLWALVDPDKGREERRFAIVGTGHDYDGDGKYIGTIQLSSGRLIFHIFERTTP